MTEKEKARVQLRMTPELHQALKESAAHYGRTLNDEACSRLRYAFHLEDRVAEVMGSQELFEVARAMTSIMAIAGRHAGGDDWQKDRAACEQAWRAGHAMLEGLNPSRRQIGLSGWSPFAVAEKAWANIVEPGKDA
jgi:hypothetical protein